MSRDWQVLQVERISEFPPSPSNALQGLTVLGCPNWIGHIPRNGLSIHLPNGMLQGNHVAARGFCGVAGRVLGNLCLVGLEQEFTLFS